MSIIIFIGRYNIGTEISISLILLPVLGFLFGVCEGHGGWHGWRGVCGCRHGWCIVFGERGVLDGFGLCVSSSGWVCVGVSVKWDCCVVGFACGYDEVCGVGVTAVFL